MGVDMMDCVLPTRAGRHGLLFARQENAVVRLNIKKKEFAEDQGPVDPSCACMVCQRYTRAYLRHLYAAQEPLSAVLNSIHNLAFYLDTMSRARADLAPGTLSSDEKPAGPEAEDHRCQSSEAQIGVFLPQMKAQRLDSQLMVVARGKARQRNRTDYPSGCGNRDRERPANGRVAAGRQRMGAA